MGDPDGQLSLFRGVEATEAKSWGIKITCQACDAHDELRPRTPRVPGKTVLPRPGCSGARCLYSVLTAHNI
jgi:hypothetical protein